MRIRSGSPLSGADSDVFGDATRSIHRLHDQVMCSFMAKFFLLFALIRYPQYLVINRGALVFVNWTCWLASISRWINGWLQPPSPSIDRGSLHQRMRYSPEAYQIIISTSVLVTIPVCMFLFIVGICLTNLLVAQLLVSMLHESFV